MDREKLEQFSYNELKQIAKDMDLPIRRSKDGMLDDIIEAFKEFEKYEKDKIKRYIKGEQLGKPGKEGTTYLVTTKNGREYAMKTFRKGKSSETLRKEADLQKRASDVGVAPNVVDIDTVSKYIVIEKMDIHLLDVMQKQGGNLTRKQQKHLITIFMKLDESGVYHADANLLNYMYKNKKLYIIDFGMAKEITSKLKKKLGTDTPNMTIMVLGFVLKLKEMKCPPSSYSYLAKYLSDDQRFQFKIVVSKK